MSELQVFNALVSGYPIIAALIALLLLFVTPPYGRHNTNKPVWGPQIQSRTGWLLMEAPASLVPLALLGLSGRFDIVTCLFMAIWQIHYFNRAFIFPFRRRGGVATMPLLISLMGLVFNVLNTYLNWRYLTYFALPYPQSWLADPRFLLGAGLFLAGLCINQHADWVLIHLRKPGETGYKIPHGGLYRFISCPNFFGEILEWTGWAIATWSMAGLGFALWTAANLVPRAIAHHRDYRARFSNYPPGRHAVIPFIL